VPISSIDVNTFLDVKPSEAVNVISSEGATKRLMQIFIFLRFQEGCYLAALGTFAAESEITAWLKP